MYHPIGGDFAVRERAVIGIFDLDNTTTSHRTRKFLTEAERQGQIVPCDELPKSFLVTQEFGLCRVYLSALSCATLERRFQGKVENG